MCNLSRRSRIQQYVRNENTISTWRSKRSWRTFTLYAWAFLVAGATLAGEEYRARIDVGPGDGSDRCSDEASVDCRTIELKPLATPGGHGGQHLIEIAVDEVGLDIVAKEAMERKFDRFRRCAAQARSECPCRDLQAYSRLAANRADG